VLILRLVESSLRRPQYPSTVLRFHGLVVQVALSKVHAVSKDYGFQVSLSSDLQEHVMIAGRWRATLASSYLFWITPFPASTAGTHRKFTGQGQAFLSASYLFWFIHFPASITGTRHRKPLLTDVILFHVHCFAV